MTRPIRPNDTPQDLPPDAEIVWDGEIDGNRWRVFRAGHVLTAQESRDPDGSGPQWWGEAWCAEDDVDRAVESAAVGLSRTHRRWKVLLAALEASRAIRARVADLEAFAFNDVMRQEAPEVAPAVRKAVEIIRRGTSALECLAVTTSRGDFEAMSRTIKHFDLA